VKNRKLTILEERPTASDYQMLRTELGWSVYSKRHISCALQNSLYCICIYEANRIIGMGRIVGDTCLCFYIQDIMVAPHVQGQGIGKIIMSHIMTYLRNNAKKGAYVGLMSKKSKVTFYQKYGFVSRPNETMGPGMVIPDFDPATFPQN
jgi:GNAT superfamily N-acetyltransferase